MLYLTCWQVIVLHLNCFQTAKKELLNFFCKHSYMQVYDIFDHYGTNVLEYLTLLNGLRPNVYQYAFSLYSVKVTLEIVLRRRFLRSTNRH